LLEYEVENGVELEEYASQKPAVAVLKEVLLESFLVKQPWYASFFL
jgi:hypothetical protein